MKPAVSRVIGICEHEEHSLAFNLERRSHCMGPSLHGYRDDVCERRGGHIHGDVMRAKTEMLVSRWICAAILIISATLEVNPALIAAYIVSWAAFAVGGLIIQHLEERDSA